MFACTSPHSHIPASWVSPPPPKGYMWPGYLDATDAFQHYKHCKVLMFCTLLLEMNPFFLSADTRQSLWHFHVHSDNLLCVKGIFLWLGTRRGEATDGLWPGLALPQACHTFPGGKLPVTGMASQRRPFLSELQRTLTLLCRFWLANNFQKPT